MPLVFIPRPSQEIHTYKWHGLDYAVDAGVFVWRSTHETGGFETVSRQADFLSRKFNVFAYGEEDVLDIDDIALMLNNKNIVPDFSSKGLELGWIAMDGRFLGCDEGNHSNLLHHTLGVKDIDQKRNGGWVMVQPDFFVVFADSGQPTEQQQDTLKKLGFRITSESLERKQNGNRKRVPSYDSHEKFEQDRQSFLAVNGSIKLSLVEPDRARNIISKFQLGEPVHNT